MQTCSTNESEMISSDSGSEESVLSKIIHNTHKTTLVCICCVIHSVDPNKLGLLMKPADLGLNSAQTMV